MSKSTLVFVVAAALLQPNSIVHADVQYTGVNLGSATFSDHDPSKLPGVYGKDYIYANGLSVDYYVEKGVNIFRVAFRWERLQHQLNGELHPEELQRLTTLVNHATAAGAHVILDPHNYARYHGTIIGTGGVSNAHFANFWSRLANAYKDNDKVVFGLMNEPHGLPSTEHWVATANTAIAAIRNSGAKNLILVPGNAWTGAHSWTASHYGTPNSVAMLQITDPGDHYAFDVHQYFDANSSGTSDVIVHAQIGVQRLQAFTQWARQHNRKGFLGEFAVANHQIGNAPDQIGDELLNSVFDYMDANSDVWLGWTWWAGGPWWGDYMFTLEPSNLGQPNQQDRAAMSILGPRLVGVPEPAAASFLLGVGGLLAAHRTRP